MTQPTASHTVHLSALCEGLKDCIRREKAGNPLGRVTVVTPGYFSSFYLRRALASYGLINVEFVRIDDIADDLAQETISSRDGRPMSRLEGGELVRAAVELCVANGELADSLKNLASQPVFLEAVQRTLGVIEAESESQLVSFSQLAEPAEITRTVGRIWESYQRLKRDQKLFDRAQVSEWAIEQIDKGRLNDPHTRLAFGKLVVLAVSVPAPQYRRLWRKLASDPNTTLIEAVTGDEGSDELLRGSIGHSAAQPPDVTPPLPDAVSAIDVRSEIASLVQRVVEDAGRGIPFNRMAVFYGDRAYAQRVRSALELAGVPVSGPPNEPLAASPAGKFLRGLLHVASTDLDRNAVGDWLATCPVKSPDSNERVAGVQWDRISKVARVESGIEQWQRKIRTYARSMKRRADEIEKLGEDDEPGSQAADGLRSEHKAADQLGRFIDQLAEDVSTDRGARQWNQWVDWLDNLITKYLYAPGGSAAHAAIEDVRPMLQRVADLDRINAGRPNLSHFAGLVTSELSAARSGSHRLGKGVFVSNVRDGSGTSFEHVHILGMADGMFPSVDVADPLLPDAVKSELNRTFNLQIPLPPERKSAQRRTFLNALMSGEAATLYWSRSSGPGSGRTGPAQWLIEQMRKHPENARLQASALLENPDGAHGFSNAVFASGKTHSDEHEYEISSVQRHIESTSPGTPHWLEHEDGSGVRDALELESERYSEGFTSWSGDLSSEKVMVPSFGGEVLSASRIENFASCPLRYMFRYVLKVQPGVREHDSPHMPPDMRGTFIHAILENYLKLRIGQDHPAGAQTMDAAMHIVVSEWEENDPRATGRVWEIEKTEIRRQMRRWLVKEQELQAAGFSPENAELSFGNRKEIAGEQIHNMFELELDDSTVLQFAGMIDRVDRHENGNYYVVDYKTGKPYSKKTFVEDPVDRGRHMQLALYSEAVRQISSPEGEVVAGYWFVMDREQAMIPGTAEFDPDHASKRLRDVLHALQRTNQDGHFPPNPGNNGRSNGRDSFDNCGYCDYDSVCPTLSRRQRMYETHSADERLSAFFNLSTGKDREEA